MLSRIKLVFLPVRLPKSNLIEVRWAWLQGKQSTILHLKMNKN